MSNFIAFRQKKVILFMYKNKGNKPVMKKFILFLAVLFAASNIAFAAEKIYLSPHVKQAVTKYRSGNYVGAIQDCQNAIKKNPDDMVAQYYMAISYVKIGDKGAAQAAYKAITDKSDNEALVEFAKRGNLCITSPEKCNPASKEPDELDKFIQSGQFLSNELQKKIRDQELKNIKDQINRGNMPDLKEYPAVNKSDAADDAYPTDKQIADAVRVLAKVGLNPLGNVNPAMMQDQDMMQLNMLLGFNGNNNQNYMNMMPYMMSSPQNMNPEVLQAMMMSQMIPDFGFDTKR